ncbi:MAG: hypothetical protein ACOVMP_01795 [Chthoniobacterales bacterium]
MTNSLIQDLPGAELIEKGLLDHHAGERSIEACLVELASPRLVQAGLLDAASEETDSETMLYALLQKQSEGRDVYPLYNSMVRRVVSFEHAFDHRIRAVKKTERP